MKNKERRIAPGTGHSPYNLTNGVSPASNSNGRGSERHAFVHKSSLFFNKSGS